MLRTLNIDSRVPTLHGVLIRRQAVDAQERAYTTVQMARAHAKGLVKSAQIDAEKIKREAMKAGFHAGWSDSMKAIYKALQDSQLYYEKIESDLKNLFQDELRNNLSQPELALSLVNEFLSRGATKDKSLLVVLPKQASTQVSAVTQSILEKTGVQPTVYVGQTNNVVIKLDDCGYEFSPEQTYSELNEVFEKCFSKLEIRKQSAQWNQELVKRFLVELSET